MIYKKGGYMRGLLFLIVLLSSCMKLEVPSQEQSTKPEIILDQKYGWDHKSEGKNWTKITRNALLKRGEFLLTKQAESGAADRWCKKFNSLNKEERIVFWTVVISEMARYESGYRPERTFKESFKDQRGKYVISAGLLQVSEESSKGYGFSDATTEKIKDPEYNLNIGVTILNRWFHRDGYIATKINGKWKGGARYWSVLRPRPDSKVYKIRKVAENISVCL